MGDSERGLVFEASRGRGAARLLLACVLPMLSCSAFNPAAVQVLLPPDVADEVAGSTVGNAPGHVPIVFINNTTFSPRLLDYLQSQGVDTSDPDLRPRVRFRVQVDFVQGGVMQFEFVDGSDLIGGSITATDDNGNTILIPPGTPPVDLVENDLNNAVVLCDVLSVPFELTEDNSTLEIYQPVILKIIRIIPNDLGISVREFEGSDPPRFLPLLVDEVDDNDTVILEHNFGTREVPGFPFQLTCGSVVAFVLSGELEVPFTEDENATSVPGYLDTDVNAQARIPGRFELTVSVR